jgi:hypothetical protein
MDIAYLHQSIAAVCPITGVSVGNPADKSTWEIFFQSSATAAQQAAAQAVMASWNINAVAPLAPVLDAPTLAAALIAAGVVTQAQINAAVAALAGVPVSTAVATVAITAQPASTSTAAPAT